jgi:hypothetical protein
VSLRGDVLSLSTADATQTHKFPAVWLRDNCQCPQCYHHESRARKILMRELDITIVPKSAEYVSSEDKVSR